MKLSTKRALNQIIRYRMQFLETIAKDKGKKHNWFVISSAKRKLLLLKKKYPYCYRTRYKKRGLKCKI